MKQFRTLETRLQRIEHRKTANGRKHPPALFADWLPIVSPAMNWQWPHVAYLRQALDAVTDGTNKRLIISIPPRHGKSTLITQYAAYRIEQDEQTRVIYASYNQTLAESFSRKIRKTAANRVYLDDERRSAQEWLTIAGGGLRAVGVGGGIAGYGGNLIICDDLVKNRESVEGVGNRDKLADWFSNDLMTRLEPDAALILIATRWHHDDLSGRLIKQGGWQVINLPALADDEGDPLGRQPGAALCPERYSMDALEEQKTIMGAADFEALYQGRPVPREGALFLTGNIDMVREPSNLRQVVRFWDLASSIGKSSDFTAGVKMGLGDNGRYYIMDIKHGRWTSHVRNERIKQTADEDGPDALQVFEIQPGSAGLDSHSEITRLLAGHRVTGERPTGSKELRAASFAAQVEGQNVSMLYGSWNQAFIEELTLFPYGKHDDMSDAASGAFNQLTKANLWWTW